MCAKSRSDTTVQTLRKGTGHNHSSAPTDRQLLSSHDAIGVQGNNLVVINIIVVKAFAHSLSSPCRTDHLSMATTVLATSLRGQTAKEANRAKAVVNGFRGTAFYVVSLVTGLRSVHPVAGYRLCLHRLNRALSQKTDLWAVCNYMWFRQCILCFRD